LTLVQTAAISLILGAVIPATGFAQHFMSRQGAERQAAATGRPEVVAVPLGLRLMTLGQDVKCVPDFTDEENAAARKRLNDDVLSTRNTLETALALSWPDGAEWSVNKIWHDAANVQFALRSVEEVNFGPKDVGTMRQCTMAIPRLYSPETLEKDSRRLRRVNAHFAPSDGRELSVYVWPILAWRSGYAVSIQGCFPATGGVWLRSGQFIPRPKEPREKVKNAWILAHEIGHALGLPHSCSADVGGQEREKRPCGCADCRSLMADSDWLQDGAKDVCGRICQESDHDYDPYVALRTLSPGERSAVENLVKRIFQRSQ